MKSWIEINKHNLLHNFHIFSRLVCPSTLQLGSECPERSRTGKIIAVVKANAYGHGINEVVKILSADADFKKNGWFGVDSLEEALVVKKISGNKVPIIILGFTPEPMLQAVVQNGFRQVVYSAETIKKLQSIAKKLGKTAIVHLKIETGTNRQGIGERELPEIIAAFKNSTLVKFEGAYSHFADIEDTSFFSPPLATPGIPTLRFGLVAPESRRASFAADQFDRFKKIISILANYGLKPSMRHMAASAASLLYPETHLDFIRLGISLYGLYSAPRKDKEKIKLLPVLSWKTLVAQIKIIKKGETVGYGRTWIAKKTSRIAVLPIGYADGYSRRFGNNAKVIINGQYAPIVGRICMNMCMIDVTKIKNFKVEDEVIIIGQAGKKEIAVEELAKLDGTINYEIVARLNPLINRKII